MGIIIIIIISGGKNMVKPTPEFYYKHGELYLCLYAETLTPNRLYVKKKEVELTQIFFHNMIKQKCGDNYPLPPIESPNPSIIENLTNAKIMSKIRNLCLPLIPSGFNEKASSNRKKTDGCSCGN